MAATATHPPTAKGAASRDLLVRTALALFRRHGYAATTLRAIAAGAGVSVGLLYRYFPSKEAVVLELYDRLSREYAGRTARAPSGALATRFAWAIREALAVVAPHRDELRALAAAFALGSSRAIFAPDSEAARARVHPAFTALVAGASDAPADAEAVGRALYLAHLVVLLFWLLDRSPRQAATTALVAALERRLPALAAALALPAVAGLAAELVATVELAVFGGRGRGRPPRPPARGVRGRR